MNNVIDFYENYDEESRLTTNEARKVEFTITTSILNEYVRNNDKILELGAGTGIYSFYYSLGNYIVGQSVDN